MSYDIKLAAHAVKKLNCTALDLVKGKNESFISRPLILDRHHIVVHKLKLNLNNFSNQSFGSRLQV